MLGRCGSEIDAISKMTAELPGQAPHAFGLGPAAERAAELGHPTSSMRSASFESSHTKAHEGRVAEGRVLMFGMPRELFRSRCSIRLPGGSWSEGFYLGSLAAGGVVAVDERDAAPAAVAATETRAERGERTADSQARPTYELGVSSGMAGGRKPGTSSAEEREGAAASSAAWRRSMSDGRPASMVERCSAICERVQLFALAGAEHFLDCTSCRQATAGRSVLQYI